MKYRKKPVIIEAFQMTEELADKNHEWPNWLQEAYNKPKQQQGALFEYASSDATGIEGVHTLEEVMNFNFKIQTLEGPMTVSWGDYIIKGVAGELYPCKSDIFEATYEKADDSEEEQAQINITPIPQWGGEA